MKKFPQTLAIILALACSSFIATGQTSDDLVKKFFTDYVNSGSDIALDNLYRSNPWITKAGVSLESLKVKMRELTKDFVGDYNGYEFIASKQLGESFIITTYLIKYDRQPLRFTFQFYKPKDKWTVYAFQYDANIDDEMEEAMKVNYLTFGKEKTN